MTHEHDDTQAELAALADGTLSAQRSTELAARVQCSPEQRERLDLQLRAIASIRSLDSIQAPTPLRQSIEALRSGAPPHRRRRRTPRLRLVGAGALAAGIAAAVAILLGTGVSSNHSAPTVLEASRLALRPATLAAPAESPHNRSQLESSVEGVAYPYWGGRLGWRTAGARTDQLDGHTVTTVFYAAHGGQRLGYAIVAGPPLPTPGDGTVVVQRGVRFHLLDSGAVTIMTWRETGHTCILAARGVGTRTLLHLVGWQRS